MYFGKRQHLERTYYEDDVDGFYLKGTFINCSEQMCYQSLRDFIAEPQLIFCDDISPIIEFGDEKDVRVNDLGINEKIFKYTLATCDYNNAENIIEAILSDGKQVIFSTMFDSLKTYAWYRTDGNYSKYLHNSLILGYDADDSIYYYVDSPLTRNQDFFIPYEKNKAIGIISKIELLRSFELYCRIGYISVDKEEIRRFPDFECLLVSMTRHYFEDSCIQIGPTKLYSGEIAFKYIVEELNANTIFKIFSVDPFESKLFESRCLRLKSNLEHYPTSLPLRLRSELSYILELLADEWKLVELCILKSSIVTNTSLNKILLDHFYKIWNYTNTFFDDLKKFYL